MTKIFKQAKIAGAVAAAMMTGLATTSVQAVHVSTTGLGEAAIVPYYSARNGYDTYISIVNTDAARVIAVKLRFRERANSRDARDFNIFLSPNDVWTGTVTMNEAGAPVVQTNDLTCTAPGLIPFENDPNQATVAGARGVVFTTTGFDGSSAEFPRDVGAQETNPLLTSIRRTYDGYVEIIEMGAVTTNDYPDVVNAIHTTVNGVWMPANCGYFVNDYAQNNGQAIAAGFRQPLNVMKVAANLINVNTGIAVSMPINTLADFSDVPKMEHPGSRLPDMGSVSPLESSQVVDGGLVIDSDVFLSGFDAVSSLFMATSIVNEYAIGGASNVLNDWVVTFPTKHAYVDSAEPTVGGIPRAPFTNLFQTQARSCEIVNMNFFDREERTENTTVPFSPAPSNESGICQETNILSFGSDRSVLAGANYESAGNAYGVPLPDDFTNGWMRLNFTGVNATAIGITSNNGAASDHQYMGLPVTGFGIKTYSNGVAAGVRLDYGVTQAHAYEKDIRVLP